VDDLSKDKNLIAAKSGSRLTHWYGVPVRILLLTFIGTLLSFAVILLLSILGLLIVSAVRGLHPDMRLAYRHIALPMALVAGGIIFVFATIFEVRNYQQRKALNAIERMG
jgi:hypothetical protein